MDKEKIDFLVTVAENCGSVTLSREDFLQLVRERNAAVEDLTAVLHGSCRFCKYNTHGFCKGNPSLDKLQSSECWEWRGVQE